MKTAFYSGAFAVLAVCVSVSAAVASPVSDIRDNAAAASSNAHIYQWKRVGLEVVRIAAAEKAAQTTLTGSPAQAGALRAAVQELRSAQFAHDAARTQAAAAQVLAAADALGK